MNWLMVHKWLVLIIIFAAIPYSFYPHLHTDYTNYESYSPSVFFTTWYSLFLGSFNLFMDPVGLVFYLLSMLVGSSVATILLLTTMEITAAVSCYYFIVRITSNEVIGFAGALVYIYSIFGQFAVFWNTTRMMFVLLPLISLLVYRVNDQSTVIRQSCILGLLFFLLTGLHPAYTAYLIVWILVVIVLKMLSQKKSNPVKALKIVALGGFIGLLLGSLFLLSFVSQYSYQRTFIDKSLSLETADWKSSSAWLHELWREMGAVSYYYYFQGWAYPNAQPFITNPFLLIASYIIPILALVVLLFSRKTANHKEGYPILLLSIVYIILLIICMGIFKYSPTKGMYQLFLQIIPYSMVFRDSYKAMILLHIVTVLLVSFALFVLAKRAKNVFRCVAFFLVVSVLVLSYQFWQGSFYRHEQIFIPQYWYEMSDHIRSINENDDRTLLLPEIPFAMYNFTSLRGKHSNFFRRFFDNNVIYPQSGSIYYGGRLGELYTRLRTDPSCFALEASRLGIRYFLNQYDSDYALYDGRVNGETAWIGMSPEEVDRNLSATNRVLLESTIGNLKLYTVNGLDVYPEVYLPATVVLASNSSVACEPDSVGRSAWLVPEAFQGVSFEAPDVSVVKDNNAIFSVSVSAHERNALLILNHRYDNGWKLFRTDDTRVYVWDIMLLPFRTPVYDKDHVVASGFANGWVIPPSQNQTSYILVYMPQAFFYWGLTISLLTLVVVLTVIIFGGRKKSKQRVAR